VVRNILPYHRTLTLNEGSYPSHEVIRILERLGITNYIFVNFTTGKPATKIVERPYFLLIGSTDYEPCNYTLLPSAAYHGFRLDTASIGIHLDGATTHGRHAITGTKTSNGDYVIIDSNIDDVFKCDWREAKNIERNQKYARAVETTYGRGIRVTNVKLYFATYMNPDIKTNLYFNISPNNLRTKLNSAMNVNRPPNRRVLITRNSGNTNSNSNRGNTNMNENSNRGSSNRRSSNSNRRNSNMNTN
jgi:hypothetical protein